MSEGGTINSAAGNAQANAAARDLPPTPAREPAQIGGRTMQAGTRGAPAMGLKISSTPDPRNAAPVAPGARGRVLPQPLGRGQNNPPDILQSSTHRAAQNRAPAPQQMGTQPHNPLSFLQSDTHRNAQAAPAANTERTAEPDLGTDLLVYDPNGGDTDAPEVTHERPARFGGHERTQGRGPMPSVLMSVRDAASTHTDNTRADSMTASRDWAFAPVPNDDIEGLRASQMRDLHLDRANDLQADFDNPMEQDAARSLLDGIEDEYNDYHMARDAFQKTVDEIMAPKSIRQRLWEMLPWVSKK